MKTKGIVSFFIILAMLLSVSLNSFAEEKAVGKVIKDNTEELNTGDGVEHIPTAIETYDNHKYLIYDYSMTWYEASQFCLNLNGHLLTVNTREEQAFITDLIANGNSNLYWIGLCKNDNEWKWVTDEPVSYTNWAEGEPNADFDGLENVTEMYATDHENFFAGEWNDSMITGGTLDFWTLDHTGFICEYESLES